MERCSAVASADATVPELALCEGMQAHLQHAVGTSAGLTLDLLA
jgi:hypothetical protein